MPQRTILDPFPFGKVYYNSTSITGDAGREAAAALLKLLVVNSTSHVEVYTVPPTDIPLYYHSYGITKANTAFTGIPNSYRALDTSGNYVNSLDGLYKYMDWTNMDWVDYYVNSVALPLLPAAYRTRITGLFLDENGEYGLSVGSGTPYGWLGYEIPRMTPAEWTKAQPGAATFDERMITALTRAASKATLSGYSIFPNAAYVPFANPGAGCLFESFGHGDFDSDSSSGDQSFYVTDRDFFKLSSPSNVGKKILCVGGSLGDGDYTSRLRFVLALWLVGCNFCSNENYFGFSVPSISRLKYFTEYDTVGNLSEAMGNKQEFGSVATYKREFLGGTVIVNYAGTTIALPSSVTGNLWGEGSTTVSSIPRKTGYVLLT